MADRVLLLLGPSAGGIRRHVATLRDGLLAIGWHVETAGPPGVLEGLGGLDHEIPISMSPVAVVRAAHRIRALASGFDVVHVHGLKAGVATVAAGVHPRILTIHNVVLDEAAGPGAAVLRRIERGLPALMDRTIAVSDEIRQRFRGARGFDRIGVIVPAGPTPRPDRDRARVRADLGVGDAPLVTTVARMHPQKDLPTMLRAARLVLDRRPDTRFVVVGDGPERPTVEAEHAALQLGEAVLLLGARANAADELAAADVVALSSLWEGSPLVVAESMLLGRPVVATAVGAVPEAVVDGETGRLVEPGDAQALADAVVDLLDHPDVAARLADAGHAVAVERFATDVLVDAVASEYRQAMESGA